MIDARNTIYNKVRSFIEQGKISQVKDFGMLHTFRRMYDRVPKDKVEINSLSDTEHNMLIYEYNILLNHYLMSCIERIMTLSSPEYIAYLLPIEIVRIAFSHDIQISEPYLLQQT